MHILVLDDQPERFKDLSHFKNAHFATSNDEAIKVLGNIARTHFYVIDELWLDHDLGGDNSTFPTVDYISELASQDEFVVRQAYVHSMNPYAAFAIVRQLNRWDIPVSRNIPFI